MKNIKTIIAAFLSITLIAGLSSCSKKEGCTDPKATNYDSAAESDDNSCVYPDDPIPADTDGNLTFNFTHNWDGENVTVNEFDSIRYVNSNNDTVSLTRLRYLISNITLHKSNGDSIVIDGYKLVVVKDGSNSATLSYAPSNNIPFATYSSMSFTFGFDSLDNTANYTDLNSANWGWPMMIGGGYHFMQMEGKFKHLGNDSTYAYHHGNAYNMMSSTSTLNHFRVNLGGFTLSNDADVEIKMNIAEWYKNPNQWDLNAMHSGLMMNYNAQILMRQNGSSVFSLGTVN